MTSRLGLLVALVALLAGCSQQPTEPPHILIWLVDTLRADHLGCYGYERPTSPTMDALARDGVLFESCHVHSNWTQPSVASLLSGCYPPDFSGDFTSRMPDGLPYASEWLAELGYDTAAFTVTMATAARFGFNRGFRVYEELDYRAGRRERKLRQGSTFDAERLVDGAVTWLDNSWRDGQPFFLMLHSVDPHLPYESHAGQPSFAGDYDGPIDGLTSTVGKALADGYEFTAADKAHLIDLYDDEIRYNDAQLGRLMAALGERELLDKTLVVIVSDHGEELFERGTHGHGHANLHAELTQVPLIMHWPEGLPNGVRVAGLMRGIDVLPTLLDLMGLGALPGADGSSVADALTGAVDLSSRRPLLFADRAKRSPPFVSAVRTDELLFQRQTDARRGGGQVLAGLFALQSDPAETTDVRAPRAADAARLDAVLSTWNELMDERAEAWEGARGAVELDAEARAALQALGYLSDR